MAYVNGSKLVGGTAYRQSQGFKGYIRRRDNHTCQLCGVPAKIIDHIIPHAVCGETKPEGVRVLCKDCNLAKRRMWRVRTRLPFGQWLDSMEIELALLNERLVAA